MESAALIVTYGIPVPLNAPSPNAVTLAGIVRPLDVPMNEVQRLKAYAPMVFSDEGRPLVVE